MILEKLNAVQLPFAWSQERDSALQLLLPGAWDQASASALLCHKAADCKQVILLLRARSKSSQYFIKFTSLFTS